MRGTHYFGITLPANTNQSGHFISFSALGRSLLHQSLLTVGLPEPFGGGIGLNQLSNTVAGSQDLIIPNRGSGQKIHAALRDLPEKGSLRDVSPYGLPSLLD